MTMHVQYTDGKIQTWWSCSKYCTAEINFSRGKFRQLFRVANFFIGYWLKFLYRSAIVSLVRRPKRQRIHNRHIILVCTAPVNSLARPSGYETERKTEENKCLGLSGHHQNACSGCRKYLNFSPSVVKANLYSDFLIPE